MATKSITAENDTVCPVCWESIHSDKPVGVTTGCGHIWHQECYRAWYRQGEYIYESSTTTASSTNSRKRYTLNSHLNCLICQQPTQSFVDLFIRLPNVIQSHKDVVTKLEHQFNTVSRRTQLSLEKEIARRDFEQTWLQEERQLSLAARHRAEKRHGETIRRLEKSLKELKVNYGRKVKAMEGRRRSSSSSGNSVNLPFRLDARVGLLQFNPNESGHLDMDQSLSFSALEGFSFNNSDEEESLVENNSNNTAALGDETAIQELTSSSTETDNSSDSSDTSNEPNTISWLRPPRPRSLLAWGGNETANTQHHQRYSNDDIASSSLSTAREPIGVASTWEQPTTTTHFSLPTRETETIDDHPFPKLPVQNHMLATATDQNSLGTQSAIVAARARIDSSSIWDGSTETSQASTTTRDVESFSDQPLPHLATNVPDATFTSPDVSSIIAAKGPIGVESTWACEEATIATIHTPRNNRTRRAIQKDTIFPPDETPPSRAMRRSLSRSRRSILKDDIFPPGASAASAPVEEEEDSSASACDLNTAEEKETDDVKPPASRKRKGSLKTSKNEKTSRDATATRASTTNAPSLIMSSAEYERQRLEAETAYITHQAELVEMDLQMAEIELEQDNLALQQREQRIRMERSRLEESFTSIQRRVEESKQESRDRQKLTVMEEKFVKYKIARRKEEERFEQELEHLKQEEAQIREREKCEKHRQETEKVRLKKELNELVKVMNRLEHAKELAKVAEEQSSASQSHETCVICFEPLVNESDELGVVECGHTFHSDCWDRWEKSRRRRGSSGDIPCPLCTVPIHNVCVTMRFGSSLYCTSTSSLAKHFEREEGRWQRRKLTDFGFVGETST